MADDVIPDPSAPDPAFTQLVAVREYCDVPARWTCADDNYVEVSVLQVRCPRCGRLTERADA